MKKFLLKSAFIGIMTIFSQGLNAQVSTTDVTSVGSCDGAASLSLSDSSYSTWTWMSGNNIIQTGGTTVNNLCEGNYNVNLTGSNIYSDTSYYFTISVNNDPCSNFEGIIISLGTSGPSICDGALSVNLQGGSAPYTYSWMGNGMTITTPTITDLCANSTYTVNIVDANGCQLTLTGTVVDSSLNNTDSLYVYPYPTDVSADGVCDGIVDFQTNAAMPFEIILSNGQISTTGYFSGLCQGIYTATIADANGDSLNVNFIISNPSNNYNNNTYGDSLSVDSLMTQLQENCQLNYNGIDSVYISSYSFSGNVVTVIWAIDQVDSISYIAQTYNLVAGNGVYSLGLAVYCPGKSLGNYFTSTDQIYYNASAGLNDIETIEALIYPNPFNDELNIQMKATSDYTVSLFDIAGRNILNTNIQNSNAIQLNLNKLSKGKYTILISSKEGILSKSIVK
jgi:hypothetical protein